MTLSEYLNQVKQRCDAATKGPWEVILDDDWDVVSVDAQWPTGCDEEDTAYKNVS